MTTWILLRGLTREGRHWGDFPERLLKQWPGVQVVPLELPGNGVYHTMASPLRTSDMAAHCHAEAARLGLRPPYRVVAMSLGAMVAVAWAQAHPGDLEACVLINTSLGGVSPFTQRLRPRAWPLLARLLLARTDARREQLTFTLTSRLVAPPPGLLDTWVHIRETRPVTARNALRQLVAAARCQAPAKAPVPTLVLTSARDGLVDGRCSTELSRRWDCAIALHPWAGHDLPLDDGPWVVRRIREWLEGGGPGVGAPASTDS